jgi:hypothetical protein
MRRILAAVPVDGALGVTLTVAVYRKIGADIFRTRTILSASRKKHKITNNECLCHLSHKPDILEYMIVSAGCFNHKIIQSRFTINNKKFNMPSANTTILFIHHISATCFGQYGHFQAVTRIKGKNTHIYKGIYRVIFSYVNFWLLFPVDSIIVLL